MDSSSSDSEQGSRSSSPISQHDDLDASKSPASNPAAPGDRSVSQNSNISSNGGQIRGEEISDCEMESERDEKNEATVEEIQAVPENGDPDQSKEVNISHEDLSDISELESEADQPGGGGGSGSATSDITSIKDLRQKLNERKKFLSNMDRENGKQPATKSPSAQLDTQLEKNTDKDEELDFEAEEGECNEPKEDKHEDQALYQHRSKELEKRKPDLEEGEELEEGEVTDGDEKRPEETEPKPVCRFYTRGQCTWGMSCRFLHPGVTDKGNYTMFDMVRPVPVSHQPGYGGISSYDYRDGRAALHLPPHPYIATPHVRPIATAATAAAAPLASGEAAGESAWERGLRTAKMMMRKANKRKEQDMDFEDKKMNLSLSQDELEKENYYIRDRASPEISPPYSRTAAATYSPTHYGRAPFEEDPYGRAPRYRELPPHRMPHYEDEERRRPRPTREVIVQRADEWNDPWMRSKSPGAREGRTAKRRSYSSNSSYSSSSSSHSGSSSDSSRSPSPAKRRRYPNERHATSGRKHVKVRSPCPTPPRRRHSPPAPKRNISPPPSKRFEKRVVSPSPIRDRRLPEKAVPTSHRKKVSSPPIVRKSAPTIRKRRRSSSSNSGSSDSSGSESDSSYSSSSDSSKKKSPLKGIRSRDKLLSERKNAVKKVEMAKKKSPSASTAKVAKSNEPSASTTAAKKSNRREELLKQLKAVEDAIARKRSRIN